jgi:hypothetical protein
MNMMRWQVVALRQINLSLITAHVKGDMRADGFCRSLRFSFATYAGVLIMTEEVSLPSDAKARFPMGLH